MRWLGSGVEWAVGLAAIGLFSAEPAAATPGVLLLLLVLAAVRYGFGGLLGAALGSGLTVSALVAVQVRVHQVMDLDRAVVVLAIWLALLGLGTVLLRSVMRAVEHSHRWEEQQRAAALASAQAELAACRQDRCGLSIRELELLQLLARTELTYAEIGDRLSPKVTAKTVKTHVENIQDKFGVTGGRRAVVRKAREKGLLPLEESGVLPHDGA